MAARQRSRAADSAVARVFVVPVWVRRAARPAEGDQLIAEISDSLCDCYGNCEHHGLRGGTMPGISDLEPFRRDYPDRDITYGVEDILREIYARNLELWTVAS